MKKILFSGILVSWILTASTQNWSTVGGSSQHDGSSRSFGPESVSSPVWEVTNSSSAMWGGAVFTSGELFATSRVKFSPSYYVTVECRNLSDGSLLWDKEFPNDGKLYVVGMNEDAVYVHNYSTDSLYAFDCLTGNIKWVCPEKAMIFGGAHGILFACNGDPVVNGPDLYEKSIMRLNKNSGDPLWFNTNMTSVGPAPDYCIYGNRLYRWEGAIGIPTHLVAVDLETGENLFMSDALAGDADQEHPLTAGYDGTIYGQRDGGDLWAFSDDGSSFSPKWFHTPENGGMGTYGNIGIGPDGSVYYPDGNVVKRLNPANGQVMNTSEVLCTNAMFGTYITTDAAGKVFVSNAEASEGKYFAFSADLQTKNWEKAVPYLNYAGPQVSREGIFIMAGAGSKLDAYKSILPHRPVSWFEAVVTEIPQNTAVSFTNMSSFSPDSWHWIFEGGNPSESFKQDPDPVLYGQPGIYSVTLITSNTLGNDTLIRECYIQVDAVPGIESRYVAECFEVYPNPSSGQFTIKLAEMPEDYPEYRIDDIFGRTVITGQIRNTENRVVTNLCGGMYIIRIMKNGETSSKKLIIR
jgi:PKD repeat protein